MSAQANPGMSYEEAERQYGVIKLQRVQARDEYRKNLRLKAEMNHQYRKALALAFAKHRAEGKPVEESKILASADAAHYELDRDLADAEAKGALAKLEELKDSRATVRAMSDWTREETG